MYQKTVSIHLPNGMHLRPAANFVERVKGFKSNITLKYKEETIPAESLFKLQALGLEQGAEVTLTAQGPDEVTAIEALSALLMQRKDCV